MANSLTVTDTHMISVFEQEALGGNTSNFFTSAGLTFSSAFFWQKQRSAFPSPHPAETFFFFFAALLSVYRWSRQAYFKDVHKDQLTFTKYCSQCKDDQGQHCESCSLHREAWLILWKTR